MISKDITENTAPTPENKLNTEHLRMLQEGSGISFDIIQARGYRSTDNIKELKELGFSKQQCRSGLLLPIWSPDGKNGLCVLRPDKPRIKTGATKDGKQKTIKYEFPQGHAMRIDCPPICREMMANPSIPLWITEGVKKADALASYDLCAIDLLGVWNFKGKNQFGGTTLLADFDYIALDGREVRIVFDSDVMTKPEVRQALKRLTEHLKRKKANVSHVYLPNDNNGQKTGVDDYLAAGYTVDDLEALIEAPHAEIVPAKPIVELLDIPPYIMHRPLSLIAGRGYLGTWVYVKVTIKESSTKTGEIIRLNPPKVKNELRLFVLRDDGKIFGDGGDLPLEELGFDVNLSEIPILDKLLSAKGAKEFRSGKRPDPIDVFKRINHVVDQFLDFDHSLSNQHTMCEMISCYIMATYFLDSFKVIGFLWPNGEKGSGKTKLLLVVTSMSYLGITILAGSSYATLRDLADYGATLAFDDAENISDYKRFDPDKRALLLAGNRKGSSTISVKEQGADKKWHTRHINAYCPRLFSAIKLPDSVLASRTIVIPLIRTNNREKSNLDPMDYDNWLHDREEIRDDLWMLGLQHLSELKDHYEGVAKKVKLFGRNLEPWRAIFAVAEWLEEHGEKGLLMRIEEISISYQNEREDFETSDYTVLVINALCHYASSASSATNKNMGDYFIITSKEVADKAIEIAEDLENGINKEYITSMKIGRILGKMRFAKEPRPGGSGSRKWKITMHELEQWIDTYNLKKFEHLFSNGTNGTGGTSGTSLNDTKVEDSYKEIAQADEENESSKSNKLEPLEKCYMCGATDFWIKDCGTRVCNVCHPKM